jgi:stage III sporulation protein AE
MPDQQESLGDGLLYIFKQAIIQMQPNITEAMRVGMILIVSAMITSVLRGFNTFAKQTVDLISVLLISITLFSSADSMINLSVETINEIIDYGKLLLPVMTAALAAQGGITSSTALYAGTTIFSTILSVAISKLIIPCVYVFMVFSIGFNAIGEDILKNLRDFVKWLIAWSLKIILYVFTGYLSITGVISGTTDAATLKAAKLTLSSTVPVVGNIISDASETILVSAGLVKNSVGTYGLLAVAAIWIGPFIQIGAQYLLLKATGGICAVIGSKESSSLIDDFAWIMGIMVALAGTVCLLLLVSLVCYMKGVV